MSAPKVDVLAEIKATIKRTSPTTHFNERANLWATHDAVAELIADHKALYRHYVNTLESGRDRIMSLGGDCDPVDRMEQSDPVLARSRSILARIGGAA